MSIFWSDFQNFKNVNLHTGKYRKSFTYISHLILVELEVEAQAINHIPTVLP